MKRSISLITVSFIISLILTAQSIAALDSETVVGMWLFDRGTGKVAEDSSENGNNGEFKGAPKWVTGKFGKALEFDGADDWVNMGNNPILKPETNADGNVTFVAWYKWEGGRYVLSSGGQTSSTGVAITHDPGAGKIWFGVSTGKQAASIGYTDYEKPGKGWHHLAGSYNDTQGQLTVYIDGKVFKQAKAGAKAVANKFPEFHLGKPNNAGAYFIKGTIDEVALFNVALDGDAIASIMNKGLEGALAVSPSGKLTTAWGAIKTYR
jgi:hypothetical protein